MYMGMEKQITSRNTIIYTSILTKKHAIKKNYLLRNTPSINDAGGSSRILVDASEYRTPCGTTNMSGW